MAQYNKTVKATGTQFFNEQPVKHTPGKRSFILRTTPLYLMHLLIQIYLMSI